MDHILATLIRLLSADIGSDLSTCEIAEKFISDTGNATSIAVSYECPDEDLPDISCSGMSKWSEKGGAMSTLHCCAGDHCRWGFCFGDMTQPVSLKCSWG